MAEAEIRTERIDDVSLLADQQCKMDIPRVLDEVIHPCRVVYELELV